MIERIAAVVGEHEGRWQLRPEPAACQGCDSGCGGRCRLFAESGDGLVSMPKAQCPGLVAGQRVALRIDEDALARAAWHGYGRVLVGLVGGALAGAGLAVWLLPESWRDPLTLLGLLAGTFVAAALSKRHVVAARVHALDAATPTHSSHTSTSETA